MIPIIGVLLGGILGFHAFVTPSRAAKEAESSLRKKFPGAIIHVDIEGKRGRDVLNGRFKNVRVELSNLKIDEFPLQAGTTSGANAATGAAAPGEKISTIGHLELSLRDLSFQDLKVKTAVISFDNVRYDFNALKKKSEIRLISFSNGKIALAIEAPALIPLVLKRSPGIQEPHVGLSGGEILVTGKREFLGAKADISVRGPIVVRGQILELDKARVELAGIAIAPVLAAPIVKTINPLYEFDEKWPFNVTIGRIGAENDVLEIEGVLTAK